MAVVKHISGSAGGFLIGNPHSKGGIKAINKSIGKPLEMEGGEVVITKPAVDDNELREFEGEMLTNRQILSRINESGGGVSFAALGAELPTEMHCSGANYKFGGETLTDYEITHRISKCGCDHNNKLAEGGFLPTDIPKSRLDDISLLIDLQKKKQNKLPTQYDINLIKNAFFNKIKKLPIVEATVILDYLTDLENAAEIKPIFSKNHKIWENYIPQTETEKSDRKPKYEVDSYVKYSSGDVEIEKWVGKVIEIKDFDIEYAYRIDAYTTNLLNPMHHSEKTNEVYEVDLRPTLQGAFQVAKKEYEKYKNLHHAKSPIIELKISAENNLSKQLIEYTGDQWNSIDFENIDPIASDISFTRPFYHKKTGKKFVVVPNLPTTNISSYNNSYESNRAIEKFLDDVPNDLDLTPAQKEFISNYSGYGGLEKFGNFSDNELKGLLYEYFTPDEIVKKMWALAYKYGFGILKTPYILEPSVGTGNFLKYAPAEAMIFGNEINIYSKRICEILYPHAQIALQPFEKNFIEKNLSIKSKIDKLQKYDLVIGNPPYGQANSKYLAMGEDNYTKARNFTEYFITRGLDLCKSGGLLIYIVGAEQYNGGTLFLDGGVSEVKKIISEKAQLLDAYRLPTKIFERTGVASEILVFKKN